jgi:hypothetical protein
MPHAIVALALVTLIAGASACSSRAAPTAESPHVANLSLGFAITPGPCRVGSNVVPASAFVSHLAGPLRYLRPGDGELRVARLTAEGASRPVTIRWHQVTDSTRPDLMKLASNLELSFDSESSGPCPLRIEFQPSAVASAEGLGSALTTIVLQEPPPPPLR